MGYNVVYILGETSEIVQVSIHHLWFVAVETYEDAVRKGSCHLLKGEANNGWSIETYAKFKQYKPLFPCLFHKILIGFGLLVPVFVFHKRVVTPQIGTHQLTRFRVIRNELCRNFAINRCD